MTVRIYRHSDASAPVLSGVVGALAALLDACLVNGYGSKTAAGWTNPYSGTNIEVFRQGTGSSNRYLRVDDAAPVTAKEARVVGYETMTDANTGTNPFPTVAQAANGQFARKSNTADATARSWLLVADERTFYLFVASGDTANQAVCLSFGDIASYKSADAYGCLLIARALENSAVATTEVTGALSSSLTVALVGHYLLRSYTGVVGAIQFGAHIDRLKSVSSGNIGSGGLAYPHPVDNGLYLSPIWVTEATSAIRGVMRGLWAPLHDVPISGLPSFGDTFSGSGGISGKTFEAVSIAGSSPGQVCIETSNTW